MDLLDMREVVAAFVAVFKRNVVPVCEAAATGSAVLLLPAAMMDLVFGSDLLDFLSPVALVVVAIAAIVIVGVRESLTAGPD